MTQTGQFSAGRRRFLLGSASLIVVGIAGKLSFNSYSIGQHSWAEHVIRRNLIGVKLDEDSLGAFVEELHRRDILDSWQRQLGVFVDRAVPAVSRWVPALRLRLDRLERLVLTEVLFGSNFFLVKDPTREMVTYRPIADGPQPAEIRLRCFVALDEPASDGPAPRN
jgi:hypothetical protein